MRLVIDLIRTAILMTIWGDYDILILVGMNLIGEKYYNYASKIFSFKSIKIF